MMLFFIYAILAPGNSPQRGSAMTVEKKRLTLDLDAPVQRRLKAVAALKGVSMRLYCQTAIERELANDEAQDLLSGRFSFAKLEASRDEILGDRVFQGDSVKFIRQSRESRNI